jgi:hypothetical protein
MGGIDPSLDESEPGVYVLPSMTEPRWTDAAWRAEAEAWIVRQLRELGLRADGAIEQAHIAWWSTVLRVPTASGPLWFKAAQARDAHEARLTPLLAALRPEMTVEVLATDAERGWLLERDAGTRLRDLADGVPQVDHWERLLPRYAELQLQLAPRVDEMLAMGLPDRRVGTLPTALASLLDEPELLLLDAPDGVTSADHERLRAGLAAFADACSALASFGLPETLQHDDLNDGNVFVRGGRHVVFDWGDACVTHPFHSLVVALRAGAYKQGWLPGGPEVTRLVDAYLEPWRGIASPDDLRRAADLARRTGTIQRSLAWRDTVLGMPPEVRAEHVDSVPYGLRLYLLDGPWGSWDDGSF